MGLQQPDESYERLLELNERRDNELYCGDVVDMQDALTPVLAPEALLLDSDNRLPGPIRSRRDEEASNREPGLQRLMRAASRAINYAFDAKVRRFK